MINPEAFSIKPHLRHITPLTLALMLTLGSAAVQAQEAEMGDQASISTTDNGNTTQMQNAGVGVNGNVEDSSVNSNSNNLSTGNNTNLNLITPTIVNPNETRSAATGGLGGNSVLMMPRNPLPLSNAALGRSNFGVQFGLQNNPILGSLGSLGSQNALGWFLQAGLTIPFGKIPDVYKNNASNKMDTIRQEQLKRQRNVFGNVSPQTARKDPVNYKTKVKGRLTGMSAYNYSAIPSSKIDSPITLQDAIGGVRLSQPKILALTPADIFTKPLNVGNKIGVVEVGSEYPYIGHTRSGWVKILLPNGSEGWTSTQFEYIKNDYTEIDNLAVAPVAQPKEKTAHRPKADAEPTPKVKGEKRVQ